MAYREKDTKKWTAQWFEPTANGEKKKRRKRGFDTKRDALEYERQKKLNGARSMDMKLSEFVEVYYEDKKNDLKERTMKNKRYMLDQHVLPYFGDLMMSEITAGQIVQWQNEMQTKGFSDAYLRMIQNQLTALFSHAARIYDLQANPCKKVKRMGSSDNRKMEFWTVEEYRKFMETIEPGTRYYIIFEILFWTGCRIGEMLALTPKDVNFETNQLSISKTYYRTNRRDIITAPKTKQSVRVVEIPEFLTKEIQEFVEGHYGMPDDERMFPIVQEAVQHKLKHQCEKSGVKKIRVHDLRHSHVSLSQGYFWDSLIRLSQIALFLWLHALPFHVHICGAYRCGSMHVYGVCVLLPLIAQA
jgi:integrase